MSPEKEFRMVLIAYESFLTLMFAFLTGFSAYHGANLAAVGCGVITVLGGALTYLMLKSELKV